MLLPSSKAFETWFIANQPQSPDYLANFKKKLLYELYKLCKTYHNNFQFARAFIYVFMDDDFPFAYYIISMLHIFVQKPIGKRPPTKWTFGKYHSFQMC